MNLFAARRAFRVERISIRSARRVLNGLKSVLHALFPFLFRFARTEQVADFLEKALALGRYMFLVDLGQLAEKLLLALGQTLRRLDENGNEQVALAAGAEVRQAVARHAHNVAALDAGLERVVHRAVQRRHFHLAAKRGLAEAERHLADQVIAVALEERMILHVDADDE